MVQPDVIKSALADDAFVSSGLLPRFLLFDTKAAPQERDEYPEPILDSIKSAWGKQIRNLIKTYRAQGDSPRVVEATPAAMELLRIYENENARRRCPDGDLCDLAPFVARWTENAWRIALVLHAALHSSKTHMESVNEETASNAIEITRWFSDRQLDLLSASRNETEKERLLAFLAILAGGKDGGVKFRDLRRNHRFEEQEVRRLQRLWPDKFEIVQLRGGGKKPSFAAIIK